MKYDNTQENLMEIKKMNTMFTRQTYLDHLVLYMDSLFENHMESIIEATKEYKEQQIAEAKREQQERKKLEMRNGRKHAFPMMRPLPLNFGFENNQKKSFAKEQALTEEDDFIRDITNIDIIAMSMEIAHGLLEEASGNIFSFISESDISYLAENLIPRTHHISKEVFQRQLRFTSNQNIPLRRMKCGAIYQEKRILSMAEFFHAFDNDFPYDYMFFPQYGIAKETFHYPILITKTDQKEEECYGNEAGNGEEQNSDCVGIEYVSSISPEEIFHFRGISSIAEKLKENSGIAIFFGLSFGQLPYELSTMKKFKKIYIVEENKDLCQLFQKQVFHRMNKAEQKKIHLLQMSEDTFFKNRNLREAFRNADFIYVLNHSVCDTNSLVRMIHFHRLSYQYQPKEPNEDMMEFGYPAQRIRVYRENDIIIQHIMKYLRYEFLNNLKLLGRTSKKKHEHDKGILSNLFVYEGIMAILYAILRDQMDESKEILHLYEFIRKDMNEKHFKTPEDFRNYFSIENGYCLLYKYIRESSTKI